MTPAARRPPGCPGCRRDRATSPARPPSWLRPLPVCSVPRPAADTGHQPVGGNVRIARRGQSWPPVSLTPRRPRMVEFRRGRKARAARRTCQGERNAKTPTRTGDPTVHPAPDADGRPASMALVAAACGGSQPHEVATGLEAPAGTETAPDAGAATEAAPADTATPAADPASGGPGAGRDGHAQRHRRRTAAGEGHCRAAGAAAGRSAAATGGRGPGRRHRPGRAGGGDAAPIAGVPTPQPATAAPLTWASPPTPSSSGRSPATTLRWAT